MSAGVNIEHISVSDTAGLEAGQRLVGCLLACLLNIPATCLCISGTDLLTQLYVLPH